MHSHTNRLAGETSPYLLQHAHNPVEWYPWGEEAFEKAAKEDKPILVSIGYSACHWCHVMERESFENEEVAAIMNRHFVNVKVDREERPDVDHVYMDAVQAISGSGGWPLNVFLTPSRKPFYGGTYFPPRKAFNRPSWTDVLLSISVAYRERKEELELQAENLTEHLRMSNSFGLGAGPDEMSEEKIETAVKNIYKTADREWGGFGPAPKFPQTFTIGFLLQYAQAAGAEEAGQLALLTLDKMIAGGIYDQAGGGFSRYSTDTEWLAPHFEKMLYDNALITGVLADAFLFTGKERYREVIEETIGFVERELMNEEGGFYSALDADSEGEEGRFYVWTEEEVNRLLGHDATAFNAYFDISAQGNWEGKNILRVLQPMEQVARRLNREEKALREVIDRGKKVLMAERGKRVRPSLDDKVLLGWNALMNGACSKAYAATGRRKYLDLALANMDFLLRSFKGEDGKLRHSWKEGKATQPAFLEDYSYLIAALIELAQVSGETHFLDRARGLAEEVVAGFGDEETPFFFFTHRDQADVLVRKKEIYDGATPSGNSVMAFNLYRLSILFDLPEWRERAEAMGRSLSEVIVKYPTSFGVWLAFLFEGIRGTSEIVILGKDWEKNLVDLLSRSMPHKLVMASFLPREEYPMMAGKGENAESLIYLCRNYACRQPVTTIEALVDLTRQGKQGQ